MTGNAIFIDTSAFVALYIADDDFYEQATSFLLSLPNQVVFVTTNFILDETYTFIRKRAGGARAVKFKNFLNETTSQLKIKRVFSEDEKNAWKYFVDLPGRGTSFTDCTSFAVMKRLGLKDAFTFDRGFRKAGFKMVP